MYVCARVCALCTFVSILYFSEYVYVSVSVPHPSLPSRSLSTSIIHSLTFRTQSSVRFCALFLSFILLSRCVRCERVLSSSSSSSPSFSIEFFLIQFRVIFRFGCVFNMNFKLFSVSVCVCVDCCYYYYH